MRSINWSTAPACRCAAGATHRTMTPPSRWSSCSGTSEICSAITRRSSRRRDTSARPGRARQRPLADGHDPAAGGAHDRRTRWSDVRILLGLAGGGVAHFELAPGRTSWAVRHRTVAEIWYVLTGRGEMWRRQDRVEDVVVLEPGVCLTIPLGTEFQFRNLGDEPLAAIGMTMPPWPGDDEAVLVDGYAGWADR